MPESKRCSHCGGNLIEDGAYHEGQKETYFRCLQCGRPAEGEEKMALMAEKKKCLDCGVEYQPTSNGQKRCVECATSHRAEVNKITLAQRRMREKQTVTKKCDFCGKEFRPTGNCQKRCADCNQKARNEYSRQWRNKQREIVKEVEQKPKPKPAVPEVRPAVGAFLDMLRPELLSAILEDARKQVAKEIVAHLQDTFLEG